MLTETQRRLLDNNVTTVSSAAVAAKDFHRLRPSETNSNHLTTNQSTFRLRNLRFSTTEETSWIVIYYLMLALTFMRLEKLIHSGTLNPSMMFIGES